MYASLTPFQYTSSLSLSLGISLSQSYFFSLPQPPFLWLCLSLYISLTVLLSLPHFLSLSLSLCLSLPISLFLFLSPFLSISLPLRPPLPLRLTFSLCVSFPLSFPLSIFFSLTYGCKLSIQDFYILSIQISVTVMIDVVRCIAHHYQSVNEICLQGKSCVKNCICNRQKRGGRKEKKFNSMSLLKPFNRE